jgi:adenine/guanine phosphoribosyltransferase-like PRPP-binding protein
MHSSYLDSAFDVSMRKFTVSVLVRYLQPRLYNGDFTHIYVRGISGLTVGSMVAYELDTPLMVLRKSKDSHGQFQLEGWTESAKCCIIDDLVASGDTVNIMRNALKGAKFAGLCLYNSHGGWEYQDNLKDIYKQTWFQFHGPCAYELARESCPTATPAQLAANYVAFREEPTDAVS